MASLLKVLGAGEDCEVLYRSVLRQDGLLVAEHVHVLGWSAPRGRAALQPLLDLRLVQQSSLGKVHAPHPRLALTRVVERENARLDLRRRELEDLAAAAQDFVADHRLGQMENTDLAALDVVPAIAVPVTTEELLRTTSGPIRSFHLAVASGAATDASVESRARAAIENGRELRSIYPVSVLDDPQHLAWVREWAAFGERQRVVENVPAEFVVLGDEAVLSAPVWGAAADDAVLIRMPLLVAAFTAVFDEAWASGLPVPDAGVVNDAGTRLLALLASGFKDEAIARYLGIGVRTVRRRVATLTDELGVHTRFQLGVVAERRGLFGRRG